MDSTILTGNPDGPHLKTVRTLWKRGLGYQTVRHYTGTKRALQAYFPVWQVDAEDVEIVGEGAAAEATVTWQTDAEGNPVPETNPDVETETVWELSENQDTRDLKSHLRWSDMTQSTQKIIVEQVKKWDAGEDLGLSLTDRSAGWFALYTLGIRQYKTGSWVLRKNVTANRTSTQIVNLNATRKVNMAGRWQIWTPAQMAASEPIPSETLFDIAAIPTPTVPSAFKWGWLKEGPQVTRSSSGRFQLSQVWALDAWSFFNYANADHSASSSDTPGLYDLYAP